MIAHRTARTLALGLLVLAACQSGPPADAAGWVAFLEKAKTEDEKIDALKALRKLDDASVAPQLLPFLKESAKVRREVAQTLGELEAKGAAQALIDALDFGGTDRATSAANIEIAEALGAIRDKAAVPALKKLLKNNDDAVKLAAVRALGRVGDPGTIPALSEIALAENVSPFVSKNAVIALGEIGHADAIPTLVKMMVRERKGVSFYMEASAALFRVGDPAVPVVQQLLMGEPKELFDWAKERNVRAEAMYAKAATLLGDFAEPSTADALMKRLNYESEFEDMKLIVRMWSAEALGRMRHPPAARVLSGLLSEEEANARAAYARALGLIGDRSVVAQALATARRGSWDARQVSIKLATQLGDDKTAEALQKIVEAEKDAAEKEKIKKFVDEHAVRLAAAGECKDNLDCWIGKVKDPKPFVRERAIYELGWAGDPKAVPVLLGATRDDSLDVRFATYMALGWYAHGPHRAEVLKGLEGLRKQLEDEKGKSYYVKVNQDLDRLVVYLERVSGKA